MMANSSEHIAQNQDEVRPPPSANSPAEKTLTLPRLSKIPMVVGITDPQTCTVLSGRLRVLEAAGFAVTLVSSPGELLDATARAEGVAVHPLPMHREIAPLADLRSFCALFWFLLRKRPVITDFSTPKAGLLGNVAAWLLRVPHRVYTLRGLKLEASRGGKRSLLLWSERLSAACAHVVLCNSESLRSAATLLKIAPAAKLRLLGDGSSNGVDTARFAPRPSPIRDQLHIPPTDPVLGFVGRLTNDKGIPELLLAFEDVLEHLPSCWLLLVGWLDRSEDALGQHCREWIVNHPRIRCTGFVPDTAPYYPAMDVLILPTHREGFPNVVLEAAASGLAVITTESTGARDAVLPEVTGLLIPPGIPEAIAEAALQLLHDQTKRLRMGAAGRAWVVEHFSNERVLGLAVEFYRAMTARKE